MKVVVLQAHERTSQPKQINGPWIKAFLMCRLIYGTLVWFCPRRLVTTQTTEGLGSWGGKKSWAPPLVFLAQDQLYIVVQDKGCLELLQRATDRGLQHGWQPCLLQRCLLALPWHNMPISLHPAFLQTTAKQGPFGTWDESIGAASLSSSWPSSLAISPLPPGPCFWLELLNSWSKDQLPETKYMQC